jgi:pimeloyl-ACP methyl ester carboxylesterase
VVGLLMTDAVRAGRAAAVQEAFRSMPERYLGCPRGFGATYHFALGDIGRTWEVRLTEQEVRVREGASGTPDTTIGTDAETWLALVAGQTSGIEAFFARRLWARGDIDLALAFEGQFRRPDGSPPVVRVHRTGPPRCALSALTLGSGPDVVLLHGLGSSKVSFFDTAAALGRDYRVHAVDLPGFGSSDKPATGRYNARYFADATVAYLDAEGIGSAHLVGNSMGGRVALEVALTRPERARTVALLCPAVAFARRPLHPLVRLSRPELGTLPHRLHRGTVERQFLRMFADPDAIDPHIAQIAVDEFQRLYRSPRGATSTWMRPSDGAASTRGSPDCRPRPCSCGARMTRSSRPASRGTSSSGCPEPTRSSSRAAVTSPRSSVPRRRSACSVACSATRTP